MPDNEFDAIVIGSGISGGWAAKELTEKGLKVIMLERGKNIEHVKDYVNAAKESWDYPHRGSRTKEMVKDYPVLSRDYPLNEINLDWWASDKDSPYTEVKRFDWFRGYHVGGRSLMWGKQSYRLSEFDFEANAKDGIAVDWPVRYKEIAPWYDHVERFAGISGNRDGLPQLPDGQFLPPMDMTCVEKDVAARINKHYNGKRQMIIGRAAHITAPIEGRTLCQFRNKCWLGCPFGAYFSTQSSTLPAAMKTGNLTLRPWSIVTKILYDKDTKKATGVEVLDAESNKTYVYKAKIIFLNASTLNSAWILMNSATDIWPDGLGSSSGELGHNLMDHHLGIGAGGWVEGYEDKYYYGRRPNGIYIPRYQNLFGDKRDYLRGFGYQGGGSREGWGRTIAEYSIGAEYKEALTEPGQWTMGIGGFGEMLPYHENKATLDKTKKDKWGLNVLAIDCELKENELRMRKDILSDAIEMLEAAGVKDVKGGDGDGTPGRGIHEMGTARMGHDPKTSVLNKWNQVWDAKNVFVTDGAFMTSAGCQNPSLTYMAFTARAADYAVSELKKIISDTMPGDTTSVNLNTKAISQHSFDAIVIGSGISGGWAAKELCQQGLKTLVIERGGDVQHIQGYPTANFGPWDLPHRGKFTAAFIKENPIVNKCYAFDEGTSHFFVKDKEHPYIQEKPFDWVRGYQVGGKSLIWARQTQRWSRFEFEGPARDGIAEWPIGYADLAPWYSHVELFAGISGNKDGLETMPDGEFLPPWDINCAEQSIQRKIMGRYKDRNVIHGRCAHLTQPTALHLQQGRVQCQARSLCYRGCPFGGYFSSNASTLPWAMKTGNMTMLAEQVVHSIMYDEKKQKAIGVRVIDAQTKKTAEYFAKIIFVNASCLNTNLVLLNSKSSRFPNGLGNDSGLLGKYIAFHNYRGRVFADMDGFLDKYDYGRRPTQVMMPNFRNVYKQETDFLRGYIVQYGASRGRAGANEEGEQIGAAYKEAISEAGGWSVSMMMQGETIPKEKNHVRLSTDHVDEWGIPQLITSVEYDENDEKLLKDFLQQGAEMLDNAGCKNIRQVDRKQAPGLDIHEMGGVRMGKDPKTSLLNKWNQLHQCSNVFVTDGACMSSTGTQNPSLTYMALTARAATHAVEELKKGNV